MKPSLSMPCLVSCLATAASLLIPVQPLAADDRGESNGPRIGSRIVLFFKDLAYGQNPNDRYRHDSAPPPRMSQRNTYGSPSGPAFSLDQPPPMNSLPPRRMAAAPSLDASGETAESDLPYTTTDEPRSKVRGANRTLADETLPPEKTKAQTPPAQKPAPTIKPPVEKKPKKIAAPKEELPAETTAAETETGNDASPTKKSWQMFNGDNAKEKVRSSPPEETKPPTPTVAPTSGPTLTGSKTTKEGRVKSPYAPFNELDVTGLPAGSLAMDPTTGKVFRVP